MPGSRSAIAAGPNVVGPVEGPTEPQLLAIESGRSEKGPLIRGNPLERMTGIEPALSAWEADVLPLNYIRLTRHFVRLRLLSHLRRASNVPQALERRNFRLAHVGRTELEPIAPWLAETRGISQRAGALDPGV